jgi:serine/threonine-protein kinase
VQRAGNQVRINVQLINAATDEHLWAETYDRAWSLENLFAIQTEIAEQVATALEATLTRGERAALADRPTNDEEAYGYYVRARDISLLTSNRDEIRIAIELLERAVARDSGFAHAWAQLGIAQANLYWQHADHTPQRLALAKRAIDRALQLTPDLADAHLALGHFYYWGFLDYERALAELEVARGLGGESAELLAGIGYVRRRQGRLAEALESFQRARQLDPRNANTWFSIAETLTLLRRYPEADTAYARMLELKPASEEGNIGRAFLQLQWRGDVAAAATILKSAERMQIRWDVDHPGGALQLELIVRGARSTLARLEAERDSLEVDDQFRIWPTDLMRAEALLLVGESATARARYASAAAQLQRAVQQRAGDERAWSALGIAYAGLGRRNEAIRAARKGVELLPVEREAWRGSYRLEELARVYARTGEPERAIDVLEDLLRRPSEVSPALLRLDPAWQPLRSHPRFRKLVEQ